MRRAKPKPAPKPGSGDFGLAILHNQLARCHADLGVLSMRLLLLMASEIRSDDQQFKPFRFRVADYQQRLQIKGKSAYENLYRAVIRLMRTVVETPDPVEGVQMFQILGPGKKIPEKGEFALRFNEEMRPLLLSLRKLFCQIPLDVFFRIKGAYAVRFYLFCKSWDPQKHDAPGWRMTVEELRHWLGFKPGDYEKTFHIRAAIIERAKRELDEVADVSFDYDPISEGGRTVGWFFIPIVNRPKSQKLDRRRKSPPALPAPEPITPEQQQAADAARRAMLDSLRNPSQSPEAQAKTSAAEACYERMKRRWDEASVEERSGWIAQGDPIIRKYFRADGPLPMRSLWSAIIPDPGDETPQIQEQAACAATALVSPRQPEEAAA